jgi:hypothetical protein
VQIPQFRRGSSAPPHFARSRSTAALLGGLNFRAVSFRLVRGSLDSPGDLDCHVGGVQSTWKLGVRLRADRLRAVSPGQYLPRSLVQFDTLAQ